MEESNKLRLADNEEAMRLKEYARNEYSVEKHKLTLLQDYIDKQAELERFVEESFHLISALHCVEYYFIPYQNEISKEKARLEHEADSFSDDVSTINTTLDNYKTDIYNRY